MTEWKAEFRLVGPSQEPVDLQRVFVSHGLASLPPMRLDEKTGSFEITVPVGAGARTLMIRPSRPGHGVVTAAGSPPGARAAAAIMAQTRHVLSLDQDLSPFYALARDDPELAWVAGGAGRMVRSPTVFEDVVKTICTTNCTWSATVRMVSALVAQLGVEAPDGRRAFPTPAAMAAASESFYRDVARTGYRGAYLRSLARDGARGSLDLEALDDPVLPDDEVAATLLALPGCGPYATAHMMMLLGRYSQLILDSWTRPKYARLNGRKASDKTIERRFRRYGDYAGLAFWLYLTRDWVEEAAG